MPWLRLLNCHSNNNRVHLKRCETEDAQLPGRCGNRTMIHSNFHYFHHLKPSQSLIPPTERICYCSELNIQYYLTLSQVANSSPWSSCVNNRAFSHGRMTLRTTDNHTNNEKSRSNYDWDIHDEEVFDPRYFPLHLHSSLVAGCPRQQLSIWSAANRARAKKRASTVWWRFLHNTFDRYIIRVRIWLLRKGALLLWIKVHPPPPHKLITLVYLPPPPRFLFDSSKPQNHRWSDGRSLDRQMDR